MKNNSLRRGQHMQKLLAQLATGGREPIITLDDWEERLEKSRRSPVVRLFIMSLNHEWPHIEPPTPLCADLLDEVRFYIMGQPGPWATVWGHIQRVAGYAVWLAEQSSLDTEAGCLAALFHDMGKLDEWDTGIPHAELGARYARRYLSGEIAPGRLRDIMDAILVHPFRPAYSQRTARLLHDADKLDKIGATGLIRRISKAEDLDEALVGAERVLDDAAFMPDLCLPASGKILLPKLAFTRIIENILPEAADD